MSINKRLTDCYLESRTKSISQSQFVFTSLMDIKKITSTIMNNKFIYQNIITKYTYGYGGFYPVQTREGN